MKPHNFFHTSNPIFILLVAIELYLVLMASLAWGIQKNLVLDESFNIEKLSSSWTRWQSTPSTAYVSNGALVVETNVNSQVVQRRLPYSPGTKYVLTFQGKSNPKTRLRVDIANFTSKKIINSLIIPPNQNWGLQTLSFQAPQTPDQELYICFYPQNSTIGGIQVDDIVIQAVEKENLVRSGNFDTGYLSFPWERWQSTLETAYVEKNMLTIETGPGWQVVQQQFPYIPGQKYRLYFQGKTNSETRLRADISDVTTGKLINSIMIPPNQDWKQQSLYFVAPNKYNHTVYIRFYPQDFAAINGKIWIDNVFAQNLHAESIIIKGKFSGDSLENPWSRWQSTDSTAYVENGELVIRTSDYAQVVLQKFFYVPGQAYRLIFDGKSNAQTRLRADIIDATNREQIADHIVSAKQGWQSNILFFRAPAEASHDLYLRFYPQDFSAIDGRVRIDNVRIDAVQESKNDNISIMWKSTISPIIKSINVENPSSLYNSQKDLMLPVDGVFELEKIQEQEEILFAITTILRKLPTLNSIRNIASLGKVDLHPRLVEPERSGHGDRRIFPTKTSRGEIIYASLDILQFSCLISHLAKTIASRRTDKFLSSVENEFMIEAIPFLHDELILPAYLEVEAWWYHPAGGHFPNMESRINAKLDYMNRPALKRKSYYKAFTDFELFLFSISSDLKYISEKYPEKYLLAIDLLDEINDKCRQMMAQRVSVHNGEFVFDKGAWDDHPDHAYASYYGSEYPTRKHPIVNGSWDSSHFHRFPWLLRNYRDAYPPETNEYQYYNNFLILLANQFDESVVEYTENGPILNNFMSGNNGWYRLRPNWGYGPYTLSNTAIWGTWYYLGEVSESAKMFGRAMAKMIRSTDPEVVQFRTRYFGERDYSKTVNPSGLRSVDILGAGTRFDLYARIAEMMHLF